MALETLFPPKRIFEIKNLFLNVLLRKYWNSIDRERVSKVGFHASVA